MKKSNAIPYLFVFLLLLIKVCAFRMLIFDDKSFLRIVLVEFPSWALLLSLLLLLVKKRVWLTAWIYNFLVSVIFFTVTLYIRYYSTVPSYYDLQQATQSATVGNTILLLSNPFDYLFFLDAVLLILFARLWDKPIKRQTMKFAAAGFAAVFAVTTIYALKQPIIDVSFFAKENGYLQSQVVQFYHRTDDSVEASSEKFTAKQLEELKGNEYIELQKQKGFGAAEGRHLFIIQVESLQEFVVGKSIAGQEVTPNLNALLDESVYFSNIFQQIGAGTTSDAEWIINTGLYPEGMIPTVNSLNGKAVPSLARILEKHSYGSATYHADDVTFWNRDVLYPVLGFDEVISSADLPAVKEVGFGPADEVVFDYALNELPRQLEAHDRFYTNIVTVTSHTPFELPQDMRYLDLPVEFEDTYTGNYLQSIRYADEQIGQFIGQLKNMGVYDESLVVIVGDHSGVHGSPVTEENKALLKKFIGHPYSMKDRFTVPLFFAGGQLFDGVEMKNLGGQVDIMPTILALLGIENKAPMMGHNLFEYKNNLLGMRYYLPGGSFIQSQQLYKAPGAKEQGKLYDLKSMETRSINSAAKQHMEDTQKILDYGDALLKPYIED